VPSLVILQYGLISHPETVTFEQMTGSQFSEWLWVLEPNKIYLAVVL
jgi:hypothetical protein